MKMPRMSRRVVAELVGDLHVYGGAALASAGLGWWVGPPAGLLVFGAFIAWLGLSLRGGKKS